MLKLIIEDDEGHTTVVPLVRDEVTIGRKEGNTIRLTERNVSRRHARLLRQDAGFAVEDLGSYTGVRVNGQRISLPTSLKDGDRVQIGDYRLDLRSDEARQQKEPSATAPVMQVVTGGPPGNNGGAAALVAALAPTPVGPVIAVGAPPPLRATSAAAVTVPSMPQAGAEPGAPPPPPHLVAAAAPGAMAAPAPALAPSPSGPQGVGVGRSPLRPTGITIPIAGLGQQAQGVPAALEGTPTIPLRTLESPPEPVVVTEQPSRLVVLNTDLAGHEFSLGRASQVIGRTDENDIVLNHRSISRHHAKILREGTRTTIVDLQSANGVRVNGQDYERVELHPGDVIELGHVKLRHVGAGEDFIFTPGKLGGRAKSLWLGGGLGGAAVLGAVLFFGMRTKGPGADPRNTVASAEAKGADQPAAAAPFEGSPNKEGAQAVGEPTLAPAPPAEGTSKTAPLAEAPVPAAHEPTSAQSTLAAVNQAILGERWEDAQTTLTELLKRRRAEPGAAWIPEAEALKARLSDERKNAAILAEVDEALSSHDGERAITRIQAIPATSSFKVKALGRQSEAVRLAVKQHLARATAATEKGACEELKAESRAINKLDPENDETAVLLRSCRPHAPLVAARAPSSRPAASPGATKVRSDVAQVRDTEDPKQDPAELIHQAREAWRREEYGKAIDLSRRVLKMRPGSPDAYQIIAVCACAQRDADGAQKAYGKLDDRSRSLVRSMCQRNGVHLGE